MIIHCNVKAGFYRTVDPYEPASSRTLGIIPKIRDTSTAICAGKDSESQGWTTTNVFGSNACRQGGQIRCTPHLSTSKHRLQNSAWQRKSARTSAITAIRSGIRPSVDGEDQKKKTKMQHRTMFAVPAPRRDPSLCSYVTESKNTFKHA